jgi:hypothetical protein
VLGDLPVVVGVESIYGRIKAVVRGLMPVDRAVIGPVEQGGAVGGGGVAITARVGPVDGRLHVGLFGVTCFRGAVATFRFLVALIRRVDDTTQPRVTGIGDGVAAIGSGVPLIRDTVALVGSPVARVCDGVPLVGHARPFVGCGKTFLHAG